jgi:hypothetical protein
MKVGHRTLLGVGSVMAALVVPSIAGAQEQQEPTTTTTSTATTTPTATDDANRQQGPLGPEPAKLRVRVGGLNGSAVHVNRRVKIFVKLAPFVDGEEILVRISHKGKTIKRRSLKVHQVGHNDVGKVKLKSKRLLKSGSYKVRALHKETPAQKGDHRSSRRFHVRYPDLDPGQNNSDVSLFNRLLRDRGYYVSVGSKYSDATQRAVMAFRKVNRMSRSWNASPGIFKKLADGNGGFHLKYPGAGRHVEVDISRQVMVLADNGKAQHIFHVSTGAPATPTIRGHYHFYRKDAGFNSLGMYYSVYFIRGYAIHGYHSVPPYNASHGCVRNPIPNSKFIYNWVSLGMSIYTYG